MIIIRIDVLYVAAVISWGLTLYQALCCAFHIHYLTVSSPVTDEETESGQIKLLVWSDVARSDGVRFGARPGRLPLTSCPTVLSSLSLSGPRKVSFWLRMQWLFSRCVIVNVLPITSESDLSPWMMVLGANKTLELNKHRGGRASSSGFRSPRSAQCLIDAWSNPNLIWMWKLRFSTVNSEGFVNRR